MQKAQKVILGIFGGLVAFFLIIKILGGSGSRVERTWSTPENKSAGPYELQLSYNPSRVAAVSDFQLRIQITQAGQPVTNATVTAEVTSPTPQKVSMFPTGGNTYEGTVDFSGSSDYRRVTFVINANGTIGRSDPIRFYAR